MTKSRNEVWKWSVTTRRGAVWVICISGTSRVLRWYGGSLLVAGSVLVLVYCRYSRCSQFIASRCSQSIVVYSGHTKSVQWIYCDRNNIALLKNRYTGRLVLRNRYTGRYLYCDASWRCIVDLEVYCWPVYSDRAVYLIEGNMSGWYTWFKGAEWYTWFQATLVW